MKEGMLRGGECVVDTLMLPNVHPSLIPAMSGTTQVPGYGAVGVLEFFSVASAITAADVAAKAANVTLLEVHIGYAIGGKGYVTLTGDVGAVKAAESGFPRQRAVGRYHSDPASVQDIIQFAALKLNRKKRD